MRVEEIQKLVADVVLPPPDVSVSQWADENRRLSCESAAERGEWRTDRAPYQRAIMDALEKEGLVLLYPAGEAFDPNHHEAVQHEPADGADHPAVSHPTVSEVFRSGYTWKGRVLRPAMVKVKG